MKLAILFGGSSNEHDISIASACSIINHLDASKYEIHALYLDKNNQSYKVNLLPDNKEKVTTETILKNIEKLPDFFTYLKSMNCVFIMIHGKNGEDGTIASILNFLNIPYVGNDVTPSVITMDKIYTKDILELNGIRTAKYISFSQYNDEYIYKGKTLKKKELIAKIEQNINYPMFIKPAKSGSSIGVFKVLNKKELIQAIKEALKIDNRILIEQAIEGKELECAILEKNNCVKASLVGEIKTDNEFYSYTAKYNDPTSQTIIPAIIPKEIMLNIQNIAIQAFKILDLHTFSRIDFFLTRNNEIILNEINSIPGFTTISMYPKLWEKTQIKYSKLLDILINEAIKK